MILYAVLGLLAGRAGGFLEGGIPRGADFGRGRLRQVPLRYIAGPLSLRSCGQGCDGPQPGLYPASAATDLPGPLDKSMEASLPYPVASWFGHSFIHGRCVPVSFQRARS